MNKQEFLYTCAKVTLVTLACLLIFSLNTALAETKGSISIIGENDVLGGSDNNYSNGAGITWTSPDLSENQSSFASRFLGVWDFLPGVQSSDHQYVSFTFAQEMHTPDDINVAQPPLDDQPYAGITYIDSTIHTRKGRFGQAWTMRLGVVGPESQADHTQAWVHRHLDGDKPQGWRTQLPTEGIVNLGYTAGVVWKQSKPEAKLPWRLVPITNIEIGNYATAAGVGLYFESGRNFSSALAASGLGRGFDSSFTAGARPTKEWSISYFLGIAGYGVAHYLPLDGTVFRNSRSVDSNDFVGIATWGIAARKGRFGVSLSASHFTETFETEREDVDFGSLTFAWHL